jgi:hypothetical protein
MGGKKVSDDSTRSLYRLLRAPASVGIFAEGKSFFDTKLTAKLAWQITSTGRRK